MRKPTVDSSRLTWRTSSYCANGSSCVEVGVFDERIAVRDSADRHGPVLTFSVGAWSSFVRGVRAGTFERA